MFDAPVLGHESTDYRSFMTTHQPDGWLDDLRGAFQRWLGGRRHRWDLTITARGD